MAFDFKATGPLALAAFLFALFAYEYNIGEMFPASISLAIGFLMVLFWFLLRVYNRQHPVNLP